METIFDYNEIKKIIPHRQPFLLIDRIVAVSYTHLRAHET